MITPPFTLLLNLNELNQESLFHWVCFHKTFTFYHIVKLEFMLNTAQFP